MVPVKLISHHKRWLSVAAAGVNTWAQARWDHTALFTVRMGPETTATDLHLELHKLRGSPPLDEECWQKDFGRKMVMLKMLKL